MLFFNFLLPISLPSFFSNSSDCLQHNSNLPLTTSLPIVKSHSLLSTYSETTLPTIFYHTLAKTIDPQPTMKYKSKSTETHTKTHTQIETHTKVDYFPTETYFETKKTSPTYSSDYNQNNQNYINTIATYYFRTGENVDGCVPVQNFNDGNSYGPCNNNQGVKYTSDSKYWVAIANAQQHCGKNIEIVYNGKSMTFQVMDNCPACSSDNHVDMGLEALIELTGSKENACAINKGLPNISWRFV